MDRQPVRHVHVFVGRARRGLAGQVREHGLPRTPQGARALIADDELLSAVRAAQAGGAARMRACGLYRQACDEWRERYQAARRAEAERCVAAVLDDTARQVWAGLTREHPWRAAA